MEETTDVTGYDAEKQLPSTEDPIEFMVRFYQSKWYKDSSNKYYEEKSLAEDVTDEEKQKVFLESDEAKFALIDFGTKELKLHYNSDSYSKTSAHTINTYIASINDIAKMTRAGATGEELESLDELRRRYHQIAGEQLKQDGVVPTDKAGRALCNLILIDKGLETAENARKADIIPVLRKFGLLRLANK